MFRKIRSIMLDPEPGKVDHDLHTFDLSRGGMGVMSKDALYPGQRMVLNVPRTDTDGEKSIYASVVRCIKENDQYRIGLEFETTSIDSTRATYQTNVDTVVAA